MKRTKIICTIGPATVEYETMVKMYHKGMNLVRLNLSHGDEKYFRGVVKNLRRLNKEHGSHVGLLWDLKGPEIRTGDLPEDLQVKKGQQILMSVRPSHKLRKGVVPVNYDGFPGDVNQGDQILLSNGLIKLKVLVTGETEVKCEVLNSGKIKSRQHINLRGKKVSLPGLSKMDVKDLRLGVKLGADWVALSFVRRDKDVRELRQHLDRLKSKAKIIAKIETPVAVERLESILRGSDAVMVARGDLGSEMPFEELPQVQEEIVEMCREAGKPVIIATHMLESMIKNPMPTRAEATDIATAVNQKADVTMLSGETAVGKYPVESVATMSRVIRASEKIVYASDSLDTRLMKRDSSSYAAASEDVGDKAEILLAASYLANNVGAKKLLVFTKSGETARLLARNRPNAQIIAFVADEKVCRSLSLIWGVEAQKFKFSKDPEKTIQGALKFLKSKGRLKTGDKAVVVSDVLLGRGKKVGSVFLYEAD